MPGPRLIEDYLDRLAVRLPAAVVAELADGLHETYRAYRRGGLGDQDAASATVAEFGDPAVVVAAFEAVNPARRWARRMLGAGPLIGAAWAAVLLTGHAWDWPITVPARVGFGAALLTGVALLAVAAFRTGYRRAGRSAIAAGLILLTLDLTMLGYLTWLGLLTSWPVLLAAALSTTRIGFTLTRFPQLLTCR